MLKLNLFSFLLSVKVYPEHAGNVSWSILKIEHKPSIFCCKTKSYQIVQHIYHSTYLVCTYARDEWHMCPHPHVYKSYCFLGMFVLLIEIIEIWHSLKKKKNGANAADLMSRRSCDWSCGLINHILSLIYADLFYRCFLTSVSSKSGPAGLKGRGRRTPLLPLPRARGLADNSTAFRQSAARQTFVLKAHSFWTRSIRESIRAGE